MNSAGTVFPASERLRSVCTTETACLVQSAAELLVPRVWPVALAGGLLGTATSWPGGLAVPTTSTPFAADADSP